MQCNGLWYTAGGDEGSTCVGPPTPAPEPAPTTQCFNSECGCPPFTDGKPWCSEQSATMGEYCEGGESLCEGDCKGVWCPVAGASTALSQSQRASHGRNLHDASAESHSTSTCYIAECGCPPFGDDVPSWCGTGDAGVNGDWCQVSKDRCMQCHGLWYTTHNGDANCEGPSTALLQDRKNGQRVEQCVDTDSNCDYYERKGYCTGPESANVRKSCPYSCGLCPPCKDTDADCAYYAQQGYCTGPESANVRKQCVLSCGLCTV